MSSKKLAATIKNYLEEIDGVTIDYNAELADDKQEFEVNVHSDINPAMVFIGGDTKPDEVIQIEAESGESVYVLVFGNVE